MSKGCDYKVIVIEAFDDLALMISVVAAARKLPDDLIQALIDRLDRVRVRTLRRLSGDPADGDRQDKAEFPRVHPAVEDFLFRNSKGIAG